MLERDLKGLAETRADRETLGLSLGGEDLSVHGQKVKEGLASEPSPGPVEPEWPWNPARNISLVHQEITENPKNNVFFG